MNKIDLININNVEWKPVTINQLKEKVKNHRTNCWCRSCKLLQILIEKEVNNINKEVMDVI